MADYTNSVPLGQAGTGAAYLIGGSKALNNWLEQEDDNKKVRAYNNKAQQDYSSKLNKSANDNAFKGVAGQMWNQELQGYISKHVDKGSQYLAQGFDVYNPDYNKPDQVAAHNDFMSERKMLDSMMVIQKEFAVNNKDQRKLQVADPYGYEEESVNKLDNFEKENSLYDVINKGIDAPSLAKRFDYNKQITDNIPVMQSSDEGIYRLGGQDYKIKKDEANIPAITGFVKNLYAQDGAPKAYLEKQIGGKFDGLLQTTDESVIKKMLDAEFRSPTESNPIVELNAKGKIPSFDSQEYKDFLDTAVKEQLRAEKIYDGLINKGVKDGAAKVNPSYSKLPNFDYNEEMRSRRRLELAERNTARLEAGDDEDSGGQPTPITIPYGIDNKDNVTINDYIPLSLPDKNFAGVDYIDMKTGKLGGKLKSSNDYAVVGVGNFPIMINRKDASLNGSIAQPDFVKNNKVGERYVMKPMVHVQEKDPLTGLSKNKLVPFDRMPENVKNSKQVREALRNFRPAAQAPVKSTAKTNTKTKITDSDFDALLERASRGK